MKKEDIKEVETPIRFNESGEYVSYVKGRCSALGRPFQWSGLRPVSILVGSNGAGKTSLLEAVYHTIHVRGIPSIYTPDHLPPCEEEQSPSQVRWTQLLAPLNSIRPKPFVYIIDNAELYLDIHSQRTLIQTIRSLDPKVQLILSTTSPSIFADGWMDCVHFIEGILEPND